MLKSFYCKCILNFDEMTKIGIGKTVIFVKIQNLNSEFLKKKLCPRILKAF